MRSLKYFIFLISIISANYSSAFEKNIFLNAEIFVDTTGDYNINDIVSSNNFRTFTEDIKKQSFTNYTYWIRFKVEANSDNYIISKNIFIDKFILYSKDFDTWNIQKSGLQFNDSSSWYSVIALKIPEAKPNEYYYLSVQSNCISALDIWLIDKQTLIKQEVFKAIFYIIILVIILIYFLTVSFLFITSRQKQLIYLAIYALSSMLMILFTNGYLYQWLPQLGSVFYNWSFVYIVNIYWGAAALLSFKLFKVKENWPLLTKFFYGAFVLLFLMMLTPLFIDRQLVAKMHMLIPTIFILFNTVTGLYLFFRRKIKSTIYLSIGWLIYLALIVLWSVAKTNHLPKSFFLDNAPAFGLILEFVIFVIIGGKEYIKTIKESNILKKKLTDIDNYKTGVETKYMELYNTLSKREEEVLTLISKGYLDKEIADELNISMPTVRTYLKRIFTKLQVSNRTEASIVFNKLKSIQSI